MYDIFQLPDFSFPDGFIWGSATAAHQIEGNNVHSHRCLFEDAPGYSGVPAGMACNHYELFREDASLVSDLGHQMYRMGIEWCRLESEHGCWNEDAFRHYEEELELYKKSGIKTMVTLMHFSWPKWFEKLGGFTRKENLHYFLAYVEKAVTRFKDLVDYWIVLNEETNLTYGKTPNFIRAHALGYCLIKTITNAPVSSAHSAVLYWPNRFNDELDRIMASYLDFQQNGVFLHAIRQGELIAPFMDSEEIPEAKGSVDFWALNLYVRSIVDSRKADANGRRFPDKLLQMINLPDFYLNEMFPEGMTTMVERFNDRPVFITENGCCCDNDEFRIVYISLYLSALHEAIKRGSDVLGYLYWSLMDNYEWGSFLPRFGLVNVDFTTFKRTPRPSAFFFKEIIENNGFSQAILRKYLSRLPEITPRA